MTNNELSVCKAQNDCIWSLYGLIKNFVNAAPSGLTRVMAVSMRFKVSCALRSQRRLL